MSGTGGREKTPAPMGKSDVIRIQSTRPVSDAKSRFAQAKSGGDVPSGGFAARAQGPGGRNANAGSQ
ncbi:hypothetical protein GT037_006068 [Alternaria burnsii]|uniref:SMP domain-containing protein n=1 Tax=Alternaria burnsii TaxID=1187904 RepID=A0A8H7B3B4_9PLEO|nr:uncharacterized protein GT037_006068 [Alternaria burnsii]KAF7676563.1 hypothetical protein GT037_006068 [Alternaria burnsii]